MAKTKVQLQDVSDILANVQEPFQAPALLTSGTAYNALTVTDLQGNKRSMQDPSKTIRPAMGIERIHAKSIQPVPNEKGPAGEQVWKLDNGDDRIRFVGSGWFTAAATSGTFIQTLSTSDYVEITFYGTGINLVTILAAALYTQSYSFDGGSSTQYLNTTTSGILAGRNYRANQIAPVISGQTLGIHSIKLTASAIAGGFNVAGFEILNESIQIKLPPGRILSNGRSATINSLQSLDYNTGFDGSPTLNGRGGRVVIYSDGSQIKKAIQQADASELNLTSVSHANEEVIRQINWREFGANRADDFSTLAGVITDRAFTLDDGTTTLVGNDVAQLAGSGTGIDGFRLAAANAFITITFVGTGLDINKEDGSATPDVHTVSVDGSSIGSLQNTGINLRKTVQIVSGLPYGIHTVKINRNAFVQTATVFYDFIIYGPKKPSIPVGVVEIGEYYLLANVSASGVADLVNGAAVIQGMVWKSALREVIYNGTWSVAAFATYNQKNGFQVFTTTNTNYFEYTFYGTSVAIEFGGASANTTCTIAIDGVLNASGSISGAGVTSAGGGTYNLLTPDGATAGIVLFTGLANAKHTIRVTKTAIAGSMELNGIFVGSNTHFPNTKVGSLALKPAIEVKQLAKESNVDLSKAKAWVVFDGVNDEIDSSYNVSAVVVAGAGNYIIYFERPFKNRNYVMLGTSGPVGGGGDAGNTNPCITGRLASSAEIVTYNDVDTPVDVATLSMAFFGELEDEGDQ